MLLVRCYSMEFLDKVIVFWRGDIIVFLVFGEARFFWFLF